MHLIELDVLPAHLAVDAVEVLHAPGDVDREAALHQHLLQPSDDVGDVTLAVTRRLLHLLLDVAIRLGAQVLKAQVFELGLEPVDAETPRQRRVDLHRLVGDALLRVHLHVLEGPHVVQSVSELHEEHADVPRHRDQHLAEALRLLVLLAREVDSPELGDAVDQERDLVAEELLDLVVGRVGVLDRVVEQGRAHARGVELHVGDDPGDAHRMDEVGITALAHLPVVHAGGIHIGLVDQIRISGRVVSLDLVEDIGQPHHAQRPTLALA